MSRSNPTSEKQANPSTRWHEWEGGRDGGHISFYNKDTKAKVAVKLPFAFIVLDELSCVKGWHDASDSGISSNEVRDTKSEPLVVKSFKGGLLAEGFYSAIRDRIMSQGGHFVSNLYCAYKDESGALQLGSVQFKGAALNSWVEFKKAIGAQFDPAAALAKRGVAVQITGYAEGKKGSILYRVPKFSTVAMSAESNAAATKIDSEILQPYLADYFRKPKLEQAAHAEPVADADAENQMADAIALEQEKKAVEGDVPF